MNINNYQYWWDKIWTVLTINIGGQKYELLNINTGGIKSELYKLSILVG